MNQAELNINRKTTLAFIAADPLRLSLTPVSMVKTGTGGLREQEEQARSIEVFRLLPQSDVQASVQTPDGVQLVPTMVLMGTFDSSMDRWDLFTVDGIKYQIVSTIRPNHTVESRYFTKADVALR